MGNQIFGDSLKRSDQINTLEKCLKYTDTGEWIVIFAYPNCGWDLVQQGLATSDKKITPAGRVALWLLGKGPDPTDSKAVEEFEIQLKDK